MLPETIEILASAGLAIPQGMADYWWRQTGGMPRTKEAQQRVAAAKKLYRDAKKKRARK